MAQVNPAVMNVVEPVVTGLGYELVGVEYLSQGRHSVLRVFLDSENGIMVEDCERVSHQLSAVLDVEDPIAGVYSLEVSSPGMERPLFKAADFDRFAGHQVRVRLRRPLDGQRKFKGELVGMRENNIVIVEAGRELKLPLEQVDKANLVPRL